MEKWYDTRRQRSRSFERHVHRSTDRPIRAPIPGAVQQPSVLPPPGEKSKDREHPIFISAIPFRREAPSKLNAFINHPR